MDLDRCEFCNFLLCLLYYEVFIAYKNLIYFETR